MTGSAPEFVDLTRLAAWMDNQRLETGPISGVTELSGGTQNILLKFQRGGRDFVLRRPPIHPRPNSNDTMRREVRILAALSGTPVPHPHLIAACLTEDVLGTAFYLMEVVHGFNAKQGLPERHAKDPALRRRMGFAIVEGTAALAQLDPVTRGLTDFGRSSGFLDRQVARWRGQLEGYREHSGWPGPAGLPYVERIGLWLDDHRPESYRPGVMHGDYHLANVLFRMDSGELAAIVDWELATIGDPLLDLGWLVATWPDNDPPQPGQLFLVGPWDGFPTTGELIAHYGTYTGQDMSAIPWYVVLACFKLAIVLEGTHARACARLAEPRVGDELHASAVYLLERALSWMS